MQYLKLSSGSHDNVHCVKSSSFWMGRTETILWWQDGTCIQNNHEQTFSVKTSAVILISLDCILHVTLLFEPLKGNMVYTVLSRKIKCLIWYHNVICEEGKWCGSQLLIQPSKNSVYQDRSMIIPVWCQAERCKLSKQRKHDLCHFAFRG
jgi:hypothetical protein